MALDAVSSWLEANRLLIVSVSIPVFSAVVAAAASWYSTRRALRSEHKRRRLEGTLKIADYRQAWIDKLRDAMAEFQSYGVLPGGDPSKEREFYQLGTKIELLMNPKDDDFEALQAQLYSFLNAANDDTVSKYSNNAKFVELCQKILKREWDRLNKDIKDATSEM